LDSDPLPPDLQQYYLLAITSGETPTFFFLILLVLLLLGSALISAAEVAYFSLTPSDLDDLSKEDLPSSKRILKLKSAPRQLLAAVLISNNFINIAIVIISEIILRAIVPEATFEKWATSMIDLGGLDWLSLGALSKVLSFSVTVFVVTFLLVLFGEVAPKIYANSNNVHHSRLMSRPLVILARIFSPFISILLKWTGGIEEGVYRRRLLSKVGTDKRDLDKAIELTVTDQEGQEEVDILKGIIKFGDVETRQIMKSRVDVIGIEVQQGFDEVISIIKESGFSRLPVYEENLDKVLGILYVKDLLGYTKEHNSFKWQELLHKNVLYVPETKKIDDLLKEFQSKRMHMAIAVDEYGGCAGIVTLEDIMEEIVGDIRDEFDSTQEIDYIKIDDHNYLFEGKTLLNDVVRVLSLEDDIFDEGRGNADSLAGLILELESMIPKTGKIITYKNMKLTINSVTKRRIEKVKITT